MTAYPVRRSPTLVAVTRHADSAPDRRPLARTPGWLPATVAVAAQALGVLDIASAVTPEVRGRLHLLTPYVPVTVEHAASAATAVAGVLLLLLGHGLRRRKRRAWVAAVALLAAGVVLNLAKGLDYEEAAVSATLGAAVLSLHGHFPAAGDPRTRWRAVGVFLGLLAVDVGAGLALVSVRAGGSFPARLQETVWGLVGIRGPLTFRGERVSDVVHAILLGLGAVTALVTAYLLLRPAEPAPHLAPPDEARLRGLIGDHGDRDSLAYFALRRDKSAVFSATGKAAISYRVLSGVMLASGDPLGDPEAWPGAVAAFMAQAARHAWAPAVMACSEAAGAVWSRHAGLSVLELGDEAIVEVAEFTLAGRAMRNVRQMVNRVARAGYEVTIRRAHEVPAAERATVLAAAERWRDSPVERGFSMALGRLFDPADPDCVLVTAHRDGRLAAMLHFVPWGRDGLSLELMRRDRAADAGVNEFMIAALVQGARELGVERVSLNFAMFRAALERGERLGAGPVSRGWRAVLVFASRWFQIDSLYRFNAKFRPIWEPRYVCYASPRDLPRVTLASLEAEAFLVWPWARHARRSPLAEGSPPQPGTLVATDRLR